MTRVNFGIISRSEYTYTPSYGVCPSTLGAEGDHEFRCRYARALQVHRVNDMTFGIGADFAELMQHVLADLSEAIGLAPTDIRLSRLSL